MTRDVTHSYEDLGDADKVFNPSRTKAAAYWVASSRQDRFDDDTTWEINAWKVPLGEFIQGWYRSHDSCADGTYKGASVAGIAFVGDDTLEIRYRGRNPERVHVPDQRPPPRRDPDDPPGYS